MKDNKVFRALALLLTLAPAALPAQAADSASSVLACMRANMPQTLRVRDFELVTTGKDGAARILRGRVFAMRERREKGEGPLRANLRVDFPENLAGASYLIRETDDYLNEGMYVYLPSVKRVRRVSGTFADGSLLGTDFSYDDFKQLESVFADASATLEASVTLDQRPVEVLHIKPRPATNAAPGSRYTSVRAWVDKEACVPVKVEFYEGDAVRKRLTAPPNSLRQADQYWYLPAVEMHDLKSGSRTILRILGISGVERVSTAYFDPKLFYLGK